MSLAPFLSHVSSRRTGAGLEACLWACAAIALGVYVGSLRVSANAAEEAVAMFRAEAAPTTAGMAAELTAPQPDLDDWSPGRVAAFEATGGADEAEALLRIDRIGLIAPVRSGTDKRTLNTFVGRVGSAANIGEGGNLVLAGHRDGYFRKLGRLEAGDVIVVETHTESLHYVVSRHWIVDPDAVHIMDETRRPSLTLITCYPFYFVGPAPQRYIVRAELAAANDTTESPIH